VKELSRHCRERAATVGYRVKALRTRTLRIVGGSGRHLNLLAPMDASRVYRDLHRAPTMIAAFGPAFVSIDPSRNPPNRRYTRPLQDFVAYKSTYGLVRSEADATALFERFVAWQRASHCRDANDPRTLPLHVFDTGPGEFDLACDEDAERFLKAFGKPRQRLDGSGRTWRAGVAHGRDELNVAGFTLPAGTHWDVSTDNRRWRIMNASEIWEIERRAYVNASPNEHIRGPQARCNGQARRIWHAGTKNAPHRKKKGH
jgi:hypothetical protein